MINIHTHGPSYIISDMSKILEMGLLISGGIIILFIIINICMDDNR